MGDEQRQAGHDESLEPQDETVAAVLQRVVIGRQDEMRLTGRLDPSPTSTVIQIELTLRGTGALTRSDWLYIASLAMRAAEGRRQ